jgi:hypothetical protein
MQHTRLYQSCDFATQWNNQRNLDIAGRNVTGGNFVILTHLAHPRQRI